MKNSLEAAIISGGSIGQKRTRAIGPVKLLACVDIAIEKAARTKAALSCFTRKIENSCAKLGLSPDWKKCAFGLTLKELRC